MEKKTIHFPTKKTLYLDIINSYCKIPLIDKKSLLNFKELSSQTLSNIIYKIIIPGIIQFYRDCILNSQNYFNLIEKIINKLKKSEQHFKLFQNVISKIEN